MVVREWESVAEGAHKEHPYVGAGLVSAHSHEGCPYAIMPDHFHALIRLEGGTHKGRPYALGDVIGAFKSRVVHEMIQLVHAGLCPPFPGKIWHRNYYEMIVRTPEAAENIRRYIRMNPWRCVTDFGNGLRGIGNPALWNAEKIGVLCSRSAPPVTHIPDAEVYMGGFHSPPEQKILEELLKRRARIIYCPAWGLDGAMRPNVLATLEDNRMLLLEMTNRDGNLAAAEERNRFVIQASDRLWIPHVTPGGMLDRLMKEMNAFGKLIS